MAQMLLISWIWLTHFCAKNSRARWFVVLFAPCSSCAAEQLIAWPSKQSELQINPRNPRRFVNVIIRASPRGDVTHSYPTEVFFSITSSKFPDSGRRLVTALTKCRLFHASYSEGPEKVSSVSSLKKFSTAAEANFTWTRVSLESFSILNLISLPLWDLRYHDTRDCINEALTRRVVSERGLEPTPGLVSTVEVERA